MPQQKCKIEKDQTGHNKPKVPLVTMFKDDTEVLWTVDKGEFRIWFPPEMDPLAPGPDVSKSGQLPRELRKTIRRGQKDKYYYSIYLIDSNEMVEYTSSPEMIVE